MAPQDTKTTRDSAHADAGATPGTARDREMGRGARPLGDLGEGGRTWEPPDGEQGISNRAGDGGPGPADAVQRPRRTDRPQDRTSNTDAPASAGVPSQQDVSGPAQDERPNDEKKTRDRGGRS